MSEQSTFRLTYATMYNPPPSLHTQFNEAVARCKANLGQEYGMLINGQEYFSEGKFEKRSPINTDMVLGVFQKGTAEDGHKALAAARAAASIWGKMKWQDRITLVRKAASIIDERIFDFASVLSLEVGKNRMEALADAAETADLMRYACDQMEANDGFVKRMGTDPLIGYRVVNYSTLQPYGVWLVISPF